MCFILSVEPLFTVECSLKMNLQILKSCSGQLIYRSKYSLDIYEYWAIVLYRGAIIQIIYLRIGEG